MKQCMCPSSQPSSEVQDEEAMQQEGDISPELFTGLGKMENQAEGGSYTLNICGLIVPKNSWGKYLQINSFETTPTYTDSAVRVAAVQYGLLLCPNCGKRLYHVYKEVWGARILRILLQ